MDEKNRNFLLGACEAEGFIKDAQGCYYTEHIALSHARDVIIKILNQCKDKRLAFSDDDNGNDLIATVYKSGETDSRLVDEVKMRGDAIVVVDDTRVEWCPWEVDIDLIELLMAMGDELQREFNL